jgi:hypothetical protein
MPQLTALTALDRLDTTATPLLTVELLPFAGAGEEPLPPDPPPPHATMVKDTKIDKKDRMGFSPNVYS